ncbi:MAG: DUF1919 domain-containing protein [Lachnospiraceae bacterium]|nr:DUF1919 domain-containing protein [Lachnospiraceae bacterium]
MNYKIIIWGLGNIYNKHVNLVKYFEMNNQIEVVALTATSIPDFSYVDGYPLISPNEISDIYYDYIIVMNDKHFENIVIDAIKYGVLREQILPYRILEIPFLDFREYIKLKKSNISIISNNCWGGAVYHTLGLECQSPFKNLFVNDEDYIKLLQKLDYYMLCELKLDHYDIDVHSNQRYPVMLLDNIYVHCNHDNNPDEVIKKWNRRKLKLNYNNLFVEMYTENKEIANDFLKLNQYIKKICFVPFDNSSKELIQLKSYPGQKEFHEVVNSNARIGNNSLDYKIVDLLNGKVINRSK